MDLSAVIAGLDPEIHDDSQRCLAYARSRMPELFVDAGVRPGHDAEIAARPAKEKE
jgi:hypothetical protein